MARGGTADPYWCTTALAAHRRLPCATILASDIDPIAVEVATANARRNRARLGLGRGRVRLVVSNGFAHAALRAAAPFDLVLANILAGPLIALAPRLRRALVPGGRTVLSGLLVTQAAQVLAAYRAAGFHLDSRRDSVGWSTLVLVRR